MTKRTRVAVLVVCALLCAACGDSNSGDEQDGSGAGSGSGRSGSGSSGNNGGQAGRAGGAGTATGDGGAGGSCMQREQRASSAVADALDDADLSCSARSDCEIISIDTDCHAACGALVSVDGKASVQAVIDAQDEGICAGFEDDGCMRVIPPCVPPSDFDCVRGRCEWLDGPPQQDAGSDADADAGSEPGGGDPEPGCIDRALTWSQNGGNGLYQDIHTLTPCATFSLERMGRRDPGADESCENEVAASAAVTVDDIDAALADADVQAAIADAPVLYGRDARPFDGTVFRIEIGSAVIDVGWECESEPGCPPIPAGVAALQNALEALTEQQRALPDCDSLP